VFLLIDGHYTINNVSAVLLIVRSVPIDSACKSLHAEQIIYILPLSRGDLISQVPPPMISNFQSKSELLTSNERLRTVVKDPFNYSFVHSFNDTAHIVVGSLTVYTQLLNGLEALNRNCDRLIESHPGPSMSNNNVFALSWWMVSLARRRRNYDALLVMGDE